MKSHVVVFVAFAFSHFVVAYDEPAPSLTKKAIAGIFDVITGGIKASPHIIGGNVAQPHSYPHQVAISYQEANVSLLRRFECGGSLIAPKWVLTATHCTTPRVPMVVYLGRHDLTANESESQDIRVQKYINNDWDSDTQVNDISLLKLEKRAILNEYVQIIRLPSLASQRQAHRPGTPVVLIGWGRTSVSADEASPLLRFQQTHILSDEVCASLSRILIPKSVICAEVQNGKTVWNGDSGGPMIVTEPDGKRTVIGIASFVHYRNLGQNGYWPISAVFTRVDQYIEWIVDHTGIQLRRR